MYSNRKYSLFADEGYHVLVDGQFGSTGKGALAAWLAQKSYIAGVKFDAVISNAGPNSGHTFYNAKDQKVVLKQLPTFAVALADYGLAVPVYLSAGAVINPVILRAEAEAFPHIPIYVSPQAAVISAEDIAWEAKDDVYSKVAGTASGTGRALQRKINRDPTAVFGDWADKFYLPNNVRLGGLHPSSHFDGLRRFVEVSQGFSLGINGQFYPKTTSRECTVMQAIADARIPPRAVAHTYMSMRTYPIRVGNTAVGESGGWYPDQTEVTWDDIGQEPELTTVTKRVRRIATFSNVQFYEAMQANDPTHVFLNFMNYLNENQQERLIATLTRVRDGSPRWFDLYFGYGPRVGDIV